MNNDSQKLTAAQVEAAWWEWVKYVKAHLSDEKRIGITGWAVESEYCKSLPAVPVTIGTYLLAVNRVIMQVKSAQEDIAKIIDPHHSIGKQALEGMIRVVHHYLAHPEEKAELVTYMSKHWGTSGRKKPSKKQVATAAPPVQPPVEKVELAEAETDQIKPTPEPITSNSIDMLMSALETVIDEAVDVAERNLSLLYSSEKLTLKTRIRELEAEVAQLRQGQVVAHRVNIETVPDTATQLSWADKLRQKYNIK